MKRLFLLALPLLAAALLACNFQAPQAPGDDEFGPLPEGYAWVSLNIGNGSRTLSAATNAIYLNYYEVYFRKHGETVAPFMGSAKEGQPLRVAVEADISYDVLLLGGNYEYKTLLASAFSNDASGYSSTGEGVPIVSGKVNQINLTLVQVTSEPDATGGTYFQYDANDDGSLGVTEIPKRDRIVYSLSTDIRPTAFSLGSGGTGFSNDEVLTYSTNAIDGRVAKIKVTSVSSGIIDGFQVLDYGRFSSSASFSSAVSFSGGNGSGATFSGTAVLADSVENTKIPWISIALNRNNNLPIQITTGGLDPLAQAGGGSLSLESEKLNLRPVNTDTPFNPVSVDTGVTEAFTSGTVLNGALTLTYTITTSTLPSEPNYGRLYYELVYYPFGQNTWGTKWSIRNGLDPTTLDKDAGTQGGGILVVIGEHSSYTPSMATAEIAFF
jgi:hypothetical protein